MKTDSGKDCLFLLLILAFVASYLSVLIPYDYSDVGKPPQWKMHHGWDEGQNIARTISIVETPYRENFIITPGMSQFYLMLASEVQKAFPGNLSLADRVALALRVLASISFALFLLGFYWVFRMVVSPVPAFISWICMTSASWSYSTMASTAKEDAFCLAVVLGIVACFISFFRRQKKWKLFLAAVLIGIGADTKQYPLLLSPVIPLILWCSLKDRKKIILETAFYAGVVILTMILACPNYYLSPKGESAVQDILFGQQAVSSLYHQMIAIWNVVREVFLLRYKEIFVAAILLVFLLRQKIDTGKETEAFYFLKRYKTSILLYITTFYLISLYKQNYYASVRYFLIGEIAAFLLFAIILEKLFKAPSTKQKFAGLFFLCLVALVFNLKRGNFNHALQVSNKEAYLKEVAHSTLDELPVYLDSLSEEERKNILSSWYIYISPNYHPRYVHPIEFGHEEARSYLTKIYQIDWINASLSRELVSKEKGTLYVSAVPVDSNSETNCFKLIRVIASQDPKLYGNYFSAVVNFHKTRKTFLSEPKDRKSVV